MTPKQRKKEIESVFKRGAQRHLKPAIFIELAPTGTGEASAWLQRRTQIGKSAGWLRALRSNFVRADATTYRFRRPSRRRLMPSLLQN
jgi:hypothetical protein